VSSDTPTLSPDKPLHVRVAEALGCKVIWRPSWVHRPDSKTWVCGCEFSDHEWFSQADGNVLLRYDTDWAATGPLIEAYGFALEQEMLPGVGPHWLADTYEYVGLLGRTGDTPLVAVCNLILALHAAGKLPEVSR
jgi:hypothetical protein